MDLQSKETEDEYVDNARSVLAQTTSLLEESMEDTLAKCKAEYSKKTKKSELPHLLTNVLGLKTVRLKAWAIVPTLRNN